VAEGKRDSAGLSTVAGQLIDRFKTLSPKQPEVSVARTVTVKLPDTEGCPLIVAVVLVVLVNDSPEGKAPAWTL
jgi:hypothetical protein